ncbi:MAG: hypothetical protein Q4E13_11475 [Clostridia bacterium]|nr:hypothetical protein [Clostridia bacterium]
MHHNDDSFAAMLLTLTLTPDKDEIVRPLTTAEFSRLALRAASGKGRSIGSLIGMDMSGILDALDCTEDEAYRICMLLNRAMPLSYALEKFNGDGIEIVTRFNDEYPTRLGDRLDQAAPAAFYLSGNPQVLSCPLIAVMGIGGVKLPENAAQQVRKLIEQARDGGYGVVGGDMSRHCATSPVREMLAEDRCAVISLLHPDALFTVGHAIARCKLIYALSSAAFVFNTDGKRGEGEAMKNRYCEGIYAWDIPQPAANRQLIAKGAIPVSDFGQLRFDRLAANWKMAQAEQLRFF